MTEPRRNSAMIPIEKRIFLRRSGVRNARANAVSTKVLRVVHGACPHGCGPQAVVRHTRSATAWDSNRHERTRAPSRDDPGPDPQAAQSWVVDPPAAAILSLALAEKACA